MPNPPTRDELTALKSRAGNLSSGELRSIAERSGYLHARSKGSHHQYTKPGQRTLVIQESMTSGTALAIVNRLLRELGDAQ